MNNEGIEDILISKDYNTKKKKGKGFFVVFFILLIILVALLAGYWYLTKDNVSSKDLFVQNISKLNVKNLLNNEIYTNILNKLQTESSELTASVKFTTDLENEELKDIDVTKFKLDISNSNDILNQKNYAEAILNYSGNEIFRASLISAENEIAVASNEIMNQYVGVHLDKVKDVFGIDINFEKIDELKNAKDINLSEEELDENIQKYFKIILENIPEEKFSIQENIAIENATEDVAVTNYSVTLTQDELENTLVTTLENIKNDKELINKLIDGSSENKVTAEETPTITPTETINDQEITSEEQPDVQSPTVDGETTENVEPEIPVIQINPVGQAGMVGTISVSQEGLDENQTNETVENVVTEVEKEEVLPEGESTINAESEENVTIEAEVNSTSENEENQELDVVETTNIEELINYDKKLEEQIINLVLGKKLDLTEEEFLNLVDELIDKVKKLSGNGIKVNVYASEENIEKINVVLPDESIIDIDFLQDGNSNMNSNQSYIKITYLAQDAENTDKNGFSLEISKEYSNASTTIAAEYSFIEKEEINKKIKLNLKTEGTANSKELKNDIVVTLSTNKGETQVAIDNEIKFKEVTDLPGLNSENCIYLDLLPEPERQSLLDTIKTQLETLYTSKKENLNFIDTNTYSQTTLENQASNQTSVVTREEAKNALITKVSNMMQEAIDRGEEFTIQSLRDLEIEGYKVSSAVTSDAALIVVDVYKFNIDTTFTLTDVE